MEFGLRRPLLVALALFAVIYLIYTTRLAPREVVVDVSTTAAACLLAYLGTCSTIITCPQNTEPFLGTKFPDNAPAAKLYGQIKNKVAVISDTQYTTHLVPLILHFHSVLGPEWPIIFYTTQETRDQHLTNKSAIWQRAVEDGRVEVRIIPQEFDLTKRQGVNLYLSRPWLWEQLAPAQHFLIFQADAMLCANSHRTADDFLEWDFIGAALHSTEKLFNGGLSLRNRTMILDILKEGNNWEEETKAGTWTMGGEDIWFSRRIEDRGGHLPDGQKALEFSCEHEYHVAQQKQPLGYHKVHKYAGSKMKEISEWCPEIALTAPGTLSQSE